MANIPGQAGGMAPSSAEKFGAEMARLTGMAKGGKVRATGKRKLHKGEMVARKAGRSKCRSGRR